MKNPIHFNPDCMTVSQVKECAEALKVIFDFVEHCDDGALAHHIRSVRENMVKEWGQ